MEAIKTLADAVLWCASRGVTLTYSAGKGDIINCRAETKDKVWTEWCASAVQVRNSHFANDTVTDLAVNAVKRLQSLLP